MNSNPTVIFWLVIGGLGQGTLLSIALFKSKRGFRPSNLWLGAFVFLISLCSMLSVFTARTMGHASAFPWLDRAPVPLNFLFGPFLYFYVLSVFREPPPARIKTCFHFVPFLLCVFWLLSSSSADSPQSPLIFFFQSLSLIGYSTASTVTFALGSKTAYQNCSTIEESHLQLLKFLLVFSLSLIALGILIQLLRIPVPKWIVPAGGALLVLTMGYRGYFVPDLFAGVPPQAEAEPASIDSGSAAKYRKTGLKPEQINQLKTRLVEMMEVRHLYRDSTLSLQKLAAEMRVTSNHLSQLLNEHFGRRFFDFVNQYRIQEAKKLLDQAEHPPNMLDLGFQVGFNSKSTFYSAFKRVEDCTPLEYHQNRQVPR